MKPTTVTLRNVRFSYAHLNERRIEDDGKPGKYESTILVPKDDKVAAKQIKNAIAAAREVGVATKYDGKDPSDAKFNGPVRDGDDHDDETHHGMWHFTARNQRRPVIIDKNREEILDPDEIYSGMWGAVNLNFFPYNYKGKKGVAVGLEAIMKTKDDDNLAGKSGLALEAVKDMFATVADDDDGDDGGDDVVEVEVEVEAEAKPTKRRRKPAKDDDDDIQF